MRFARLLLALVAVAAASSVFAAPPASVDKGKTKKVLLVTDSGGFIHDSVGVAEQVLKEIGPANGFEVTCYRFTRQPDEKVLEKYSNDFRARTGLTVTKENCGRVNKETLKNFDCVFFFTTGNPLTPEEVTDLDAWVKAGGAFAGTHCATDTLYNQSAYGALVGGYFDGHPWNKEIKVKVEDPNHPAGTGFKTGDLIKDEIYQFKTPYSRDKLHIIMSVDNSTINVSQGKRPDQDYAISWCHDYGNGRSFYTSLGHFREVWKDPRFQKHLVGGLKWAMKEAEGSAVPSAKSGG